jgi:hypothetical protein
MHDQYRIVAAERAQGCVMQFQFVQGFAALELEVMDHEIRFCRRWIIGRGGGDRKQNETEEAHGSIITRAVMNL